MPNPLIIPTISELGQSLGVSVVFDAAKLRTLRIIERENVLK